MLRSVFNQGRKEEEAKNGTVTKTKKESELQKPHIVKENLSQKYLKLRMSYLFPFKPQEVKYITSPNASLPVAMYLQEYKFLRNYVHKFLILLFRV